MKPMHCVMLPFFVLSVSSSGAIVPGMPEFPADRAVMPQPAEIVSSAAPQSPEIRNPAGDILLRDLAVQRLFETAA